MLGLDLGRERRGEGGALVWFFFFFFFCGLGCYVRSALCFLLLFIYYFSPAACLCRGSQGILGCRWAVGPTGQDWIWRS